VTSPVQSLIGKGGKAVSIDTDKNMGSFSTKKYSRIKADQKSNFLYSAVLGEKEGFIS
jgi:hypothetical protein